MKRQKHCFPVILLLCSLLVPGMAAAEDLYFQTPLDSGYYQASGSIIAQDDCTISADISVLFAAAGTITLKPGFHAQAGSSFTAIIDDLTDTTDDDGDNLADWWELMFFGSLNQAPSGQNGDYDGDGIANYIEYRLNTDPTDHNDRPTPGIKYEYDALGRIKAIWRIPRQ